MGKERRKQHRASIWIDVAVRTEAAEIPAIATDISGDGIRFQAQKVVLPGEKIQVVLQLNYRIEFHGTAVWTINSLVQGLSVYDVGVEISTIVLEDMRINKPDQRETLVEELLKKLS
jgi:hypothetical protein